MLNEREEAGTRAPDVTVVIPTRDRPALLREALECALGQVDVKTEVVVVDDGSDPPLTQADIGGVSGEVRLLRHDLPLGDAAARNSGAKDARGRWVAFLDDDDLWSPVKLKKQLEAIEAVPGAVYAYCGAVEIDAQWNVIRDLVAPDPGDLPSLMRRKNVMPAGSSNVVVLADVFADVGGFDESFRNISDWDLWLGLLGAGPAARCGERLVAYRRHSLAGVRGGRPDLTAHSALSDPEELLGQLRRLEDKRRGIEPPFEPDWVDYSRWLVAAGPRRAGRRLDAAALYLRFGLRYRSAGTVARGLAMPLGERVMRRLGEPKGDLSLPEWLRAYR